jgi:hypothetical protein
VQRLIRREWVAVLAAAASLQQDLVVTMIATAESLMATWTSPLRRMGTEAGNLLTGLPGFRGYGQAKAMRVVIHWYLRRNKCTFPPGDGEWFNWDTMSGGMTGKLEAMKASGVDTEAPGALVVSIQKRGWMQSQEVQRAIKAPTRVFSDYDVGCFVSCVLCVTSERGTGE